MKQQIEAEALLTHPDKIIFPQSGIRKIEYLLYLRAAAPFMFPFLANRALTVIRYPHGIGGLHFFQKNCPDYAPSFVRTAVEEGIRAIVCDRLDTLLWLGNQLAIEFHIPFRAVGQTCPIEIVIDLDPPDRAHFPLAVDAALLLHGVLERLQIASFPKLSGSRGLQIHIPLSRQQLTFEDTRRFTTFLAEWLIEQHPDRFTTERLKKNRGSRLYVDYIQHAEGKTIICPYSLRAKPDATVAMPLAWNEVTEALRIESFTMATVQQRLAQGVNPWKNYFLTENRALPPIIASLRLVK